MKCDELNRAELVLVDHDLGLLIAWFGGHGFEVFDEVGHAVDHFSSSLDDSLTVSDARAIIVAHFEELRAERDGNPDFSYTDDE